ncbi:hypothetical protein CEUSTIGMA_g5286.t1 [Chlamydomonas eustigma]|uniref:dCMP deaminase n=1 Tax=Chlamydomonas eustigma TaxID=1157962 RepID=A0A250X438_9CHLO|nr:hypothetical protein CEUSTIGMA_g5286.t1 [Chlamydomonas eustigma]|eukprot:GAX77844.1 hypothetical protein CEUSTIGMA_g5286.t1 [Chlamydomonas eustigma]
MISFISFYIPMVGSLRSVAIASVAGVASSLATCLIFFRQLWIAQHADRKIYLRLKDVTAVSSGAASVEQSLSKGSEINHVISMHAPRSDPFDTRPREGYLSWDDYFMSVAFLSAQRSKDPSKQVGACIVDQNQVILGIGYNGFPRGCPDGELPWSKKSRPEEGLGVLGTKYPYVVHAEANALLNKNAASVSGAKVYVTLFPCGECAKLLIQAGIKEVIYHETKGHITASATLTSSSGPTSRRTQVPYSDSSHSGKCLPELCNNPSALLKTDKTVTAPGMDSSTPPTAGKRSHQYDSKANDAEGYAGIEELDGSRSCEVHAAATAMISENNTSLEHTYFASFKLLTLAGVRLRQHRSAPAPVRREKWWLWCMAGQAHAHNTTYFVTEELVAEIIECWQWVGTAKTAFDLLHGTLSQQTAAGNCFSTDP